MAKIIVNNPRQVINGGAKKYYFKVKGLGGPKGDKGDKGDTGSQGPQGPQGNAATVSIGSTTTLPVGNDATVTNSGSIYNAVLNFGIPQGPRGPQGATGAKGDKGDKGDQGNPGPQGEKGTNATVTVGTTTTTEPGTQAYAWNSSSNPNNAVINFNIPRGATGSQGPQGVQGPIGPAGADGESFTPVVVSSLPSTGTEGKLYLTPKNYTTGTATGNPITISLGEDAGQIDSFQLDGDTYQQTYTGKNLLTFGDSNLSGSKSGITYDYNAVTQEWYLDGTAESQADIQYPSGAGIDMHLSSGVRYTTTGFYQSGTISNGSIKLFQQDSNHGWQGITVTLSSAANASEGFTPNTDIVLNESHLIRVAAGTVLKDFKVKFQTESGSSVSSYEPFVSGIPSPNPDYPQQIQTVTGTQTISINGTNYPIDLGSIELNGLGDDGAGGYLYNDGIYENLDDNKWYLHKETGKYVYNNDLGENGIGSTYVAMLTPTLPTLPNMAFTDGLFWCNSYTPTMRNNTGLQGTNASGKIRVNTSLNIASSYAQVRALAAANNLTIYYPLATPTDTEITNSALISQLEAIRTANLQASNTITNTATGSNLAGDMELGYYEYDPNNRYDKWLWLDLNNNYEKLGS